MVRLVLFVLQFGPLRPLFRELQKHDRTGFTGSKMIGFVLFQNDSVAVKVFQSVCRDMVHVPSALAWYVSKHKAKEEVDVSAT
jgi:hypothetical protein